MKNSKFVCPYCKGEISKFVLVCPNCNKSLDNLSPVEIENVKAPKNVKKKEVLPEQRKACIISVLFVLFSGFVFFQSVLAYNVLVGNRIITGLFLFRNAVVSGSLPTYYPIVLIVSGVLMCISVIRTIVTLIRIFK